MGPDANQPCGPPIYGFSNTKKKKLIVDQRREQNEEIPQKYWEFSEEPSLPVWLIRHIHIHTYTTRWKRKIVSPFLQTRYIHRNEIENESKHPSNGSDFFVHGENHF